MPKRTSTRISSWFDRVEEVAQKKGAPGQLAIAWLLHQGDDIVPIPSTKRVRYLEENLGAADVVIAGEDPARIEEAMPKGSVFGARYAEAQLAALDE